MRYIVISLLLTVIGCTPPTQPIAQRAMDLVNKNTDRVVDDFSNISYQLALDKATAEARREPNKAAEILEQMGHEYEIIESRRLSYERSKQLSVLVKLQIIGQKGFLNILAEEIEDAKNRVDTKRTNDKSDK